MVHTSIIKYLFEIIPYTHFLVLKEETNVRVQPANVSTTLLGSITSNLLPKLTMSSL